MSGFLDQTISVRQIWRWMRRAMYIAVPVYLSAAFMHEWNVQMTMTPVGYKEQIPEDCFTYAARSSGRPAGQTLFDTLLFRGRVFRSSIDPFVNGVSKSPACLGYAVLAGLVGQPGYADFSDQWLDAEGNPVVTVHVMYHKAYLDSQGRKK